MNTDELDIRWPIGLLFILLGALVAVYGALAPQSTRIDAAFSVNLNLAWGVVMVIFGLLMIWGARRASRRTAPTDEHEQAARNRA